MEFDSTTVKMVIALSLINLLAAASGILVASTGRILGGILTATGVLILGPGLIQYLFLKSSQTEE